MITYTTKNGKLSDKLAPLSVSQERLCHMQFVYERDWHSVDKQLIKIPSKFGLHVHNSIRYLQSADFQSLVLRSARHVSPTQFFATELLWRQPKTGYPELTSPTILPFLRMLFIPKVQMLSPSKLPSQTHCLPSQREEKERRARRDLNIK